jgi:8-oxo-dGTP pyrophosphatase MutT (NUDIX family)
MKQFQKDLQKVLARELPGEIAQLQMAPQVRKFPATGTPFREAAVLIMLYPRDGQIFFPLIKRTESGGPHSGQVSFPGGMAEPGDKSLEQTALRETREEIGIPERDVSVLGRLSSLHIPVSNYLVHPFIGMLHAEPVFHTDTSEVSFVIEVSLAELLLPSTCCQEKRNIDGKEIVIPYYNVGGQKVWGATAMILAEFLAIIEEAGPDPFRR